MSTLNQAPVAPGQSVVYELTATNIGTRWHHARTDIATQVMLGLCGSLIVEPKDGEIEETDRDDTVVLSEWDLELMPAVAMGKAPRGPRDSQLRDGELGTDPFLMNGKTHEAFPPIVVSAGDAVRVRLINAGTVAHPYHTHGHSFPIVATDGNPVPPAAQLTKDTVWIAPGERYDIVFEADNPGVWMAHCHIENHAANGMMTVIQYEGVLPSGPLAEIWNLSPETTNPQDDSAVADAWSGMHSGHHTPAEGTPESPEPTTESEIVADFAVPATPGAPEAPVTPATVTDQPASAGQAPTSSAGTDGGVVSAAKGITIAVNDDRFGPTLVEITAGTTVTWVNQGGNIHSVASLDGAFSSVAVMPGESFSYTYDTPGTYAYVCKHHARQGMTGKIVVTG